ERLGPEDRRAVRRALARRPRTGRAAATGGHGLPAAPRSRPAAGPAPVAGQPAAARRPHARLARRRGPSALALRAVLRAERLGTDLAAHVRPRAAARRPGGSDRSGRVPLPTRRRSRESDAGWTPAAGIPRAPRATGR